MTAIADAELQKLFEAIWNEDGWAAEREHAFIAALNARLEATGDMIGKMVGVLRPHQRCGDQYPEKGWPEVNAVLAQYAAYRQSKEQP